MGAGLPEKLVKGPVALYEQMRVKVLDLIAQRGLRPHDPIPSEGELAEMFGVSRRTSKEALELLAKEGIVYRLPRRGTFLSEDQPRAAGDFLPSRLSMSERMKRAIAIVVPKIDEYSGQVVASALQQAVANDFELLVRVTGDRHDLEDQLLKKLVDEEGAAGVICFPGDRKTCGHEVLRLHIQGFPIVLVDRVFKEITIPAVYHDHHAGAYSLATYMIGQGHRKIGIVSEPIAGIVSREDRYQGFLQALIDNQCPYSSGWLFDNIEPASDPLSVHTYTEESLLDLRRFMEKNQSLTALFCTNDFLAAACLRIAYQLGISVPKQLSIAGFTDLSIATHLSVPLTTVRKSPSELGAHAVELLLKRIADPDGQHESVQLQTPVILRASVDAVSLPTKRGSLQ